MLGVVSSSWHLLLDKGKPVIAPMLTGNMDDTRMRKMTDSLYPAETAACCRRRPAKGLQSLSRAVHLNMHKDQAQPTLDLFQTPSTK